MKNAINPILGHSPKQEKVDSVTWVVMMVILMLDLTRKWLTAQQQNFSTWNHMTKRTPLIWFSSKPEKKILRLTRSKQDALMSSCTASSGGKEANCFLKPTLFTIKRDKNRRKHAKLAFYKNCSDLHENRAPGGILRAALRSTLTRFIQTSPSFHQQPFKKPYMKHQPPASS